MPINILYVENSHRDYLELKNAADEYNSHNSIDPLGIYRALDPDEMKGLIGPQFSVILADVFFNDPQTGEEDQINRLKDIIEYVNDWCKSQSKDTSIPIIAYTGRATLEQCLEQQDYLYDIWDKNTTNTNYVIWRLSNLSIDMSRYQPDAYMQTLIREMTKGASWHDKVKEMTIDYDSALNEYDQIYRVDKTIGIIANNFDTENTCVEMWGLIEKSEPITRALNKNIRGHARHAINVFWLGYYILNSSEISDLVIQYWKNMLIDRPDMKAVKDVDCLEALNNIWFYTGLFHDIGINVEKYNLQYEQQKLFKKHFNDYALPLPNLKGFPLLELPSEINDLINEISGKEFGEELRDKFLEGIKGKIPDHGLVAATYYLKNIQSNMEQKKFAKEAARATLLHNIISEDFSRNKTLLNWENDFISCLLLVCDQLQTWDRQREDKLLIDEEKPERAELKSLSFEKLKDKYKLSIFIDYIAPVHVVRHPYHYQKLRHSLTNIILKKPNKALKKIAKPWPFELYVNLTLGRKEFYKFTYK